MFSCEPDATRLKLPHCSPSTPPRQALRWSLSVVTAWSTSPPKPWLRRRPRSA